MAHFAELNENNDVLRVIVVDNNLILDNGVESEQKGIDFCKSILGGNWIQTSYNGSFRKNFASVGFTYNPTLDAFIPPKPFASWILDEDTCSYQPPVPIPGPQGEYKPTYSWSEETLQWVNFTE